MTAFPSFENIKDNQNLESQAEPQNPAPMTRAEWREKPLQEGTERSCWTKVTDKSLYVSVRASWWGGVSTLTLKQARPVLETGRVPLWVHGLPIPVGTATPPRWAHLNFTLKCKHSWGKVMSLDQASLLNWNIHCWLLGWEQNQRWGTVIGQCHSSG